MIVFTDFRRIARLEMRRADCNKRIRKCCCFVQSALLYADRMPEHRKSENQKCRKEFCRALSTVFKSRKSYNNERHEKSCCGAAWKNIFFLGIVTKNEHDDAYLCSLIRLHSLANNVFTSLRLANLTGTADSRFVIFIFHSTNCRTAFFPDILPLGKISSGRDTAKSVILNNKRPPLTQPPSQSYSVPEPAGQGEKVFL